MRIPSGTTDQYIYFVAVDATDFVTRETGLTTFTVYRSRDGGAAAAMTTPTINEVDATNMPGVYELLLDEDMTIGSGNDSEEMVFHITHSGMAPVTRTIELYRPKITTGETLTVTSGLASANATQFGGAAVTATTSVTIPAASTLATTTGAVGSIASGGITSSSFATGAITAASLAADAGTEIGRAVWDVDLSSDITANLAGTVLYSNVYTPLGNLIADIGANGAGLTALPWNAAWDAEVQSEVADGLTAFWTSPATLVDLVWDEAIAGHLGAGSVGEALNAAGSAGDPWTTSLPGSYTGSQAGKMLSDILTDTAEIGSAGAGLTEAGGTGDHLTAVPWNAAWDAEVQSECTDALNAYDPPTNTEMVAAFTEIKGSTWATTDTLEAIRDRGDAAWTTATGFSTHSAADVRTEMDSNSTQLAAIVADTNELQTDWANGGRLDLILDTVNLWAQRNAVILSGLVTGAGTGTEVFTISALGITATVTVDTDGNRSALVWS